MKSFYLSNVTHIQQKNIDICEPDNLDDIALYSHHRLDYVAWLKELQDWHNEDLELTNTFFAKVGGPFIWVSVVSSFLETTPFPAKKLEKLLSEHSASGLKPEIKVTKLYLTILGACDLNMKDEDFKDGYKSFIGTIIAMKELVLLNIPKFLHPDKMAWTCEPERYLVQLPLHQENQNFT